LRGRHPFLTIDERECIKIFTIDFLNTEIRIIALEFFVTCDPFFQGMLKPDEPKNPIAESHTSSRKKKTRKTEEKKMCPYSS